MAEQNHTVFDLWIDPYSEMSAPGVRSWRGLDWQIFSGKAEALIACGVAQTHWFPAEGVWKQRKLTVGARLIKVARTSKSHFRVLAEYLPEEKEHYEIAVKKDRELREAKEQLDRQERQFAVLAKTAAEYLDGWAEGFFLYPDKVTSFRAWSDNAFHFDDDTMGEVQRLAGELFFVFQHGRIVFDPAVRERSHSSLKAARAKADPDFQKLMARLKGPPE